MPSSAQIRLKDSDPLVRCAALDELAARSGECVAAEAAAYLLQDEDAGVREHAARFLTACRSKNAAEKVAPLIKCEDIRVLNLAGEVLLGIGEASVAVLEPYLDDDDRDVRKFVIDLLAELPAGRLVDAIARRLDDEEPNVVIAAIEALGALRGEQYTDRLADLYEREPYTRPAVVTALSSFRNESSCRLLQKALSDPDPFLQLTAAEGLASRNEPGIFDVLVKQVQQVDAMARPIVIRSLVDLIESQNRPPEDLPDFLRSHLIEMLDDSDESFQIAGIRGLKKMLDETAIVVLLSHAGISERLDVEIFNAIAEDSRSLHILLRLARMRQIAPTVGVGFTLGLLSKGNPTDLEISDASGYIIGSFDDLDTETKLAAINVGLRIGGLLMESVLHVGLDDPDPMVASFAADAASRIEALSTSTGYMATPEEPF